MSGWYFAESLQGFFQSLAYGLVGNAGDFSDGRQRVGFLALESEAQLEEVLFVRVELAEVVIDFRVQLSSCGFCFGCGDGFDGERGALVFDGVLESRVAATAGG